MTRLERLEYLKSIGYTYDVETGKIYGKRNNEIINKDKRGYVSLYVTKNNKRHHVWGHHFVWYMFYGNDDFIMLDHINQNKGDNRINNLRSVKPYQNLHNKNSKGYWWDKDRNKWATAIKINGITKTLGRYNTKEEALEVYMKHKKDLIPK